MTGRASGLNEGEDAKRGATLCREIKNPGGTCQPGFQNRFHHPGKAHPGLPREGRLGFVVMMVVEDHVMIEAAKKAFLPRRGKFFLYSGCGRRPAETA
jgi:hypothetical protein